MEERPKGTVTPIASLFPAEEAKKAAKRVDEAIVEKQKQLDQIYQFSSDNTNLIRLVKRLPGELFHDVMVPFGKAAFFPGRLIHTNEFLVLLGEGYYAERTSKQTVDILQRRERDLKSQYESLNAVMLDLKAEASFFNNTAAEAEEGLVEIRENYVEEHSSEGMSNHADFSKSNMGSSEDNNTKEAAEDEEYAKVMKKLDELEREELMEHLDELEGEELAAESLSESEEDEDVEAEFGCSISERDFDRNLKISQDNEPRGQQKGLQIKSLQNTKVKEPYYGDNSRQSYPDRSFADLRAQHVAQDGSWSRKNLVDANAIKKPGSSEKIREISSPTIKNSGATSDAGVASQKVFMNTTSNFDSSKTFIGSVVEHSHGLPSNTVGYNSKSSELSGSNPSKPVSRFKIHKGTR